jgi:hypothetical protein
MERARKKAGRRGKGRMPSAASEANGRGGKRIEVKNGGKVGREINGWAKDL